MSEHTAPKAQPALANASPLTGPRAELGGDLLGPKPTLLPSDLDAAAREALECGEDPSEVVAAHPTSPAAWAVLAKEALADGEKIAAYAFARVGYHRGLDALRRAGWRGSGPIPSTHEPNRGILECLLLLAECADAIGEVDEVQRLREFIAQSDPTLA